MGHFPMSCWSEGCLRLLKQYKLLPMLMVSHSKELDDKAYLLKMPLALVARHREMKLELSWKLLLHGLVSLMPKGAGR